MQPAEDPRNPVSTPTTRYHHQPRELDLVRPHEPGAIDIDQLPVKHILLQQHFLWPAGRTAAESSRGHHGASTLGPSSVISPITSAGTNTWGTGNVGKKSRLTWRVLLVAEPDYQIIDGAETAAEAVQERSPHDKREVKERGCLDTRGHRAKSTPPRDRPPRDESLLGRRSRLSVGH